MTLLEAEKLRFRC